MCVLEAEPVYKIKSVFLLQSEGIKPDDITWDAFQKLLDNLCLRPEIQSIFEERCALRML